MEDIIFGLFSDTHLREDLVFDERVDVFIHSGDLLELGDMRELVKAARYFKKGLAGRPMLYTPGNHDNIFESSKAKEAADILKDAGIKTYIDAGKILNIKGHEISIYFMPWVPETTPSHAFNLPDNERRKYIDKIPLDIDILVTHGPPQYILDESYGRHFGDDLLLKKIDILRGRLRANFFGHIHESRGVFRVDDNFPLFINAANGSSGIGKPILISYPSLEIL